MTTNPTPVLLKRTMRAFMLSTAAVALALTGLFAHAADDPAPPVAQAAAHPAVALDPARIPTETRRLKFAKLANRAALRLRTTEGRETLDFSTRADELVTRAQLRLRYTYSPALIASQSHIKVLLNGEIVGVISLTRENAGRTLEQEMELDPRYITGFNKLTLEFVGHYTNECEDPLHTSLWADVSGSSELILTVRPVPLQSDLAMIPQPFLDKQDLNRARLPYVFAAKPSYATLRAAGITASWFGKLASWRGARFPATLDTLPKGHAVVFATNDERPSFLAEQKPYVGPALSIITNPADGYSKLLLVTGRNSEDLRIAATSLVLGQAVLSGTSIDITRLKQETPRKAYDAPNWVRLDRPMKFGELIEYQQQLQVFGHVPDPIRIGLRMPPDLFTWRSRGVPVDFKFRYTAPIRASESRLAMSLNEELVQAVNLKSSGQSSELARIVLPMIDGGLVAESSNALIPPYKLAPRNQLQYAFSFTYHKEGSCRDTQVENVRAMIDPDSTIDFSGFPHYAELPHLGYFSTAGYPFTKYADLQETTIVMPQVPTARDIEVMLTLLGRMGESTGYPATRVAVAGPGDSAALKDRDLLLIGTSPNQPLLDKWGEKLPAIISGPNRRISEPTRAVNFVYDWLGFGTEPDPDPATSKMMRGDGPLAAILGFESPVTSSRSVVAVTASDDKDITQVLDVLDNEGMTRAMHGSAVFVRGDKAESILAGDTYTVGVLPFWLSIWYPLAERPLLLLLVSLFGALLLLWAIRRGYRALTARPGKEHA